MLKVVQTKDEAIELSRQLAEAPGLEDFRVGVTGAFMDGSNKRNTPIEIVLKLKTDSTKSVGTFEVLELIQFFMVTHYYNKYEVHWLDLLAQDEEDMIRFVEQEGIEHNPNSIYTNIVELAQWADGETHE